MYFNALFNVDQSNVFRKRINTLLKLVSPMYFVNGSTLCLMWISLMYFVN